MQQVDLVVPVKNLALAKSRLRGAADGGVGDVGAHARLTVALARDTIAAARATPWVGRVVAITSDPDVFEALERDGVGVIADRPGRGLNAALRHGARVLRRTGSGPIGALLADLPALRPAELTAALRTAAAEFAGTPATRAFCADERGLGTTLLVCAAGSELDPRFGGHSAVAHESSGAVRLDGDWPGLRHDVDTPDDLAAATAIGLGPATRDVLGNPVHR